MAHEEMLYNPKKKKILMIFPLNIDKSREGAWEWIVKVWGNGGRNMKLNQSEFQILLEF